MNQNESKSKILKTQPQSSSNSSNATKIVTFGGLDLTLSLKLPMSFFDEHNLNFNLIENNDDLSFLSSQKDIWKDITLFSDSEPFNFCLQLNKATIQKVFVSFVCLSHIEISNELNFFIDIVNYVSEKNWVFLNFEDLAPCPIKILFNLECEGDIKTFIICNQNYNNNNDIQYQEPVECDIKEQSNKSSSKENDVLKKISGKQYESFDYIYFDLKYYTEGSLGNIISIQELGDFYYDLKDNYNIQIITYFTNILTHVSTADHVFALEKILQLTDFYLFEKKDAYSIFNFLHIIQHKDDSLTLRNNTMGSRSFSDQNLKSTTMSNKSNKISIVNLDKKKMFSYFSNEIISQCPVIYYQKIAVFMDEFTKLSILPFNSSDISNKTYEFDTLIYPKINHFNISIVNEYRNIVNNNYDNFLLIFFGSFIGRLIQDSKNLSFKSLYLSYLTAIESSKKILEVKKNKLPIPNNPKFYIVKLPNNAINSYLKEESMKQKESKFTLDCLNKKKSQLQFYNPLFDYHLHSYFNSHVNRKVLRTKGFINSKGYIMYDPVYRDLLGNSPQRKKQVPDKVLLNSITRLNIGKDISNKEIDVFNTVLKKTSPINRKLPMYHSLNKSNSTLYSNNGQTNRNFNKTTRVTCNNKLPPIKKENQLGSSASMNCVFDTKKSYYKSEKSIENEKKRLKKEKALNKERKSKKEEEKLEDNKIVKREDEKLVENHIVTKEEEKNQIVTNKEEEKIEDNQIVKKEEEIPTKQEIENIEGNDNNKTKFEKE